MSVHCHQIESRVQQYLDHELDETQQQSLLLHLQQCESCQAAWQPLLAAIRDVEQAPAVPLPAGLLERVLTDLPMVETHQVDQDRIQPIHGARPRRAIFWFSSITAAAAALLLAVFWPHAGLLDDAHRPTQVAQADPQALMWLAAGIGTAPIHGQTGVAIAAGQAAAWAAQPADREQARIVVCMADLEPTSEDAMAMPHVPDAIQILANHAAMQGGL